MKLMVHKDVDAYLYIQGKTKWSINLAKLVFNLKQYKETYTHTTKNIDNSQQDEKPTEAKGWIYIQSIDKHF